MRSEESINDFNLNCSFNEKNSLELSLARILLVSFALKL